MHEIRISKRLEAFTVEVDLRFSHRVTGFYGPSGSGKTTLLDMVAGLTAPDLGRVTIAGTRLFDGGDGIDVPVRRRRVGYVFQDGVLFEHLSVARNLRYSPRDGDGPSFAQVVDVLELAGLLERPAGLLSGGEKRRVALGRALLSAPRVLLLDEPLTGLDRRLAGKTLCYIKAVLDTFELPAIYVSHSVSDIIFLCDEVAVMDRGRVVSQGPPADLLDTMENLGRGRPPTLKNIFAAAVVEVDEESGTFTCALGETRLQLLGGVESGVNRVTLMLPAHDIILASRQLEGLSARNVLRGKVLRVKAVGARRVVFVDVGVEWMVEVTQQAERELQLQPGSEIFAVVKASSISAVDAR